MKEKVSVIIPTKNRIKDTIATVKTIFIQTILPDEIIVVDSSDTKELGNKLKQFDKSKIKYIHTKKSGRCYQRNLGIKKSSGDILVFLDDDVILDKDFLKEILYVFNNYPKDKIGGVTSPSRMDKQRFTRKVLTYIHERIANLFLLPKIKDGNFQLSGLPTTIDSKIQKINKCEFLYGFSMSFRKEIFDELVGFDENLEKYSGIVGDDDDIGYRASKNHQNFHTPFAKLTHNKSPASRESKYDVMRNGILQYRYIFKNHVPQDLIHKSAFWWAIAGLFIKWGIIGTIRRDKTILQGMVAGVKEIRNEK